ncbi:hypothetical protein [Halorientalis pallida]|uniref:MarR family protein n=1 Tax=Halorientalis pallida TaxID=2479928 RepID=A0A498KT35_9EURY|nr:hypothetical protein [Halorientalis pallida]RXK47878.1 hypothetical protein EAF64_14650 [Halorientalis pallida]
MSEPALTPFERALLSELADDPSSPAELAISLNTDLSTVLDTTGALQKRGFLDRQGFGTCRLTDQGEAVI